MRKLLEIHSAGEQHWVGDGFPVRSVFSYDRLGPALSPFLLLDHAGPAHFSPTDRKRGVGAHPHRGFETVTLVYEGEVEHRDSAGNGGRIGAGDVQWMTAGGGIVHEEYHSRDFARSGGTFEVAQLWVNLPARHKMTAPAYQTILKSDIPVIELEGRGASLRVLAGEYGGTRGPARTFTPMNVWDAGLDAGADVRLAPPGSHNVALVVLKGQVVINGAEPVNRDEVALFDRGEGEIAVKAETDAKVLVLTGEPLNEPIVGYGPFVMNTSEEIQRAYVDFQRGTFLAAASTPPSA